MVKYLTFCVISIMACGACFFLGWKSAERFFQQEIIADQKALRIEIERLGKDTEWIIGLKYIIQNSTKSIQEKIEDIENIREWNRANLILQKKEYRLSNND